jgi:hypothetical protein
MTGLELPEAGNDTTQPVPQDNDDMLSEITEEEIQAVVNKKVQDILTYNIQGGHIVLKNSSNVPIRFVLKYAPEGLSVSSNGTLALEGLETYLVDPGMHHDVQIDGDAVVSSIALHPERNDLLDRNIYVREQHLREVTQSEVDHPLTKNIIVV